MYNLELWSNANFLHNHKSEKIWLKTFILVASFRKTTYIFINDSKCSSMISYNTHLVPFILYYPALHVNNSARNCTEKTSSYHTAPIIFDTLMLVLDNFMSKSAYIYITDHDNSAILFTSLYLNILKIFVCTWQHFR